ncbi:uncharacterized protein N7496_006849 [Penicillium cataractarum]|uniref:Xylanolytic transcriptional activator regulatory domain-containing protein n=1 Tax=Penicillium cataractarum TaxID=2100454 RepID=A0A9W9S315_9EURO|nr:uncharacterized protein N7496_006849 [Penicillium cataractarum]KAJ5370757.1 hypothetical protein N7496_006849 [Penicillium cataractarum]
MKLKNEPGKREHRVSKEETKNAIVSKMSFSKTKECISSEPVSRKSRISTESLEEKIAELEAQLPRTHQAEAFHSRRQVVFQPSTGDSPALSTEAVRCDERAISEPEGNCVPLLGSQRDSSDNLGSTEGLCETETERAQQLCVPVCTSISNISVSSPLHSTGLIGSPIFGDKCGHTSLLTSILATLARGSPCGISAHGDRALRNVYLSPHITTQLLNPDHSIRLPSEVEDALVKIYLERVNPRYPFLHVSTFLEWYETWKARPMERLAGEQNERWKDFFVKMVQAVSILLTPQVSQNDIATSQVLYNTAMKYLSFVFTHPDPVLHVQAHLLLTLHALHSPSSQMIITMVAATMRQCVISSLHLSEYEPKALFPEFSQEVQIRRRVFWSAYAIDRLISWIYHIPNNLTDEHITVELFSNVDDASLAQDTANLAEPPTRDLLQRTRISPALHLIRCRCIQSRIINTILRSDFHQINSSSAWREHMLEELETWRTQVQRLSHRANRGYLSDRWVGMAYNYTIALLHQPTKDNVCNGFGDRSVSASVKLALTFRAFQKDRQTAQLWPGLLSQFTVGVTILYCFWATPPAYRTPAYRATEVSEALRACSTALAILAERWTQAEPLRDVFDILAKEIPTHEGPDMSLSSKHITSDSVVLIKSHMRAIQEISRNRVVLRMLQEIMEDDFPSSPQDYLQQTDSPRGNHLCSEHCAMFHGTAFFDSMMNLSSDTHNVTGSEMNEAYTTFDDTIIFPALFGSAEF